MLSICIWKEWREHRATFVWLLAIALSVQILLVLLLPEFWVGPQFLQYSLLVWTTIAMLLFSTSLVQSEYRREEESFALRLPLAERHRFYAKVLMALCLVLGTLVLIGVSLIFLIWLRDIDAAAGLLLGMRWLPILISFTLLFMGVAWWLPRSAVVHPLVLLLLGLVASPFLYTFIQRSWVRPSGMDMLLLGGLCLPLVSFMVARISAIGRRTSAKASLLMGGIVFLVGFTGISLTAATRIDDWDRYDPQAPGRHVYSVLVGEGARFAYINARWEGAGRQYALIADLETGSFEQMAGLHTGFASATADSTWDAWYPKVGEHSLIVERGADGKRRFRRGLDAKPWHDGWLTTLPNFLISETRKSLANTAWLRTARMERVWFFDGFERGDATKPIPYAWLAGLKPGWPMGSTGMKIRDPQSTEVYFDLFRQKTYGHPDSIKLSLAKTMLIRSRIGYRPLQAITPAGWILKTMRPGEDRGGLALHDPDTGEERSLLDLHPWTQIVSSATLPDGRLVLIEPTREPGENQLLVYDVKTQKRHPIPIRSIAGIVPKVQLSVSGSSTPIWTRDGRLVVSLWIHGGAKAKEILIALDPQTLETRELILPSLGYRGVLACPDESQVLILIDSEIRRFRWGQEGSELLWPRPKPTEEKGGKVR